MTQIFDAAVCLWGALLAHLAPRPPIPGVAAFPAAAPPPWSLPARRHLHAIGMADAEFLFGQRQAEDREGLAGIGAMAGHLGLPDALVRRVGESARGLPGPGRLPDPWRQRGRWGPRRRRPGWRGTSPSSPACPGMARGLPARRSTGSPRTPGRPPHSRLPPARY